MSFHPDHPGTPRPPKWRMPRSFKDLTPTKAFNPATFFYHMVWKALLVKRTGASVQPEFPSLDESQIALTWIGHASFLIQFQTLNVLVDPNFANWLFLLKRVKKAGIKIEDLPPVDLVLLTHAHFDHMHRPSLKKLPSPRIAIVPWGVGKLAKGLGFDRIIELQWWETFCRGNWKVTLTPSKHWGARTLRDQHRGFGGFILAYRGRKVFHAGDSAYFDGFKEIGCQFNPEIALLPIGAYHPESFRNVHMGPDEAIQAFEDLGAKYMVPMHYGSFRLSFEDLEEPPRWLRELARNKGIEDKIFFMDEGLPRVF